MIPCRFESGFGHQLILLPLFRRHSFRISLAWHCVALGNNARFVFALSVIWNVFDVAGVAENKRTTVYLQFAAYGSEIEKAINYN